jgi:Lrp/AsnC family transcriptional regulator, leucine-responsive regulatory protein
MSRAYPLDEIDRRLLDELQGDCKLSLQALGEIVDLSAPAVLDRVRKLEQAGVITGYHAIIDGKRVGLDITAFIGVSINYPKDIDRFLEHLAAKPEVLECHHITGGHTLLLKIKTEDTASLEKLISSLRWIEGVTRTETMVVLSTATEHGKVPLPAVSEDVIELPKRRTRKAG